MHTEHKHYMCWGAMCVDQGFNTAVYKVTQLVGKQSRNEDYNLVTKNSTDKPVDTANWFMNIALVHALPVFIPAEHNHMDITL